MLRILFYFMMGWTRRDAYYRFVFYFGDYKEDVILNYFREFLETGSYSDPNHEIILKWYPIDVWDLKKRPKQMEWRVRFTKDDVKRIRECGGKEYATKYVRVPAEYFDSLSEMVICITLEDPARNIRDADGPYYLPKPGRYAYIMKDPYNERTNTFNEYFLEDKYMGFKEFDYVASCTGDDMFHFNDIGVGETLTNFVREFARVAFKRQADDAHMNALEFKNSIGIGPLWLTFEGERGEGFHKKIIPSKVECSIS